MLIQCGHSRQHNNAAAHNAKFMGRNLADRYKMQEIFQQIEDNSFEDLFIGDYFDITISTSFTASEVVRCILAHFNYYTMTGDTAFIKPHAVVTIKNCLTAPAKMNTSDSTWNGYATSYMRNDVLAVYAEALKEVFNSHLLTYKDLLTTAINATTPSMAGAGLTGASTNWGWHNTTLSLMSEAQVYGTTVWSSSGYDTGIANRQLALFQHDPTALVCKLGGTDDVTANNRVHWWLRDVTSDQTFARVDRSGNAGYDGASTAYGVRPLFCIG